MKLSDQHINLIRLIERSPDLGEGWRMVSNQLTPFFTKVVEDRTELYETKVEDDTFFVRLSERGQILKDYV